MPGERSRYLVEIDRDAERVIRRLPADVVRRIRAAIVALADNPRPPGCKKLRSENELWRVRVGDWRVLYEIHDNVLLVVVVRIGPRGSVYKKT